MILINLVPPSQRPPLRWDWSRVTRRRAAAAGGLIVALLTGGPWLARHSQEQAVVRLRAEWEALAVPREEWESHRQAVAGLERQAHALGQLRASDRQWAGRLNLLSDAVVPGVWFTRLTIDPVEPRPAVKTPKGQPKTPRASASSRPSPQARLIVEGTALVESDAAGSPVAAFVTALKRHPAFPHSFASVEIQSVARRRISTVDVSDFVLRLEVAGS